MCGTCGCGSETDVSVLNLQTGEHAHLQAARHHARAHDHVHADGTRHSHAHAHGHEHTHFEPRHGHDHDRDTVHDRPSAGDVAQGVEVDLHTRILAKNDALAARNRAWFAGREILALNLVSSPGAGKTTLLERTIRDLSGKFELCVVEGDQATANDGERIRAAGAPVVQVNTGAGCHLEADMVARGLKELRPKAGSVVLIENVGNLVCPALFDLGERAKVVVFSITEGEDKPLKYPHMFRAAELVLLNKVDLAPHVEFDIEGAIGNVRQVNPRATVLKVSARTGEGLATWYDWLGREADSARQFELA